MPLLLSLLLFLNGFHSPFSQPASVRVLIFARTDCPITNRYAPELARLAALFANRDVKFWIVYPDHSETEEKMARHMADYHLPGIALSDPQGLLRKRAEATVSPQAAVFNQAGKLLYSGRIDDRYISFGKSRLSPQTHDLENAIQSTLNGKLVSTPRTKAIGCYLDDLN